MIQFMLLKDDKIKNNIPDLLFNGFNLWDLKIKEIDGKILLVDEDENIVIDENVYNTISDILIYITGHEKPKRIKYDNFLKKRYIEDCREDKELKKQASNKKSRSASALDGIILRLVCNANFPYNFETVNNVTLFDLIYSLKQIEKDINVTDLMQGRLVGADLKKIPSEQLSRFVL